MFPPWSELPCRQPCWSKHGADQRTAIRLPGLDTDLPAKNPVDSSTLTGQPDGAHRK
jgi:hypothetical protein